MSSSSDQFNIVTDQALARTLRAGAIKEMDDILLQAKTFPEIVERIRTLLEDCHAIEGIGIEGLPKARECLQCLWFYWSSKPI